MKGAAGGPHLQPGFLKPSTSHMTALCPSANNECTAGEFGQTGAQRAFTETCLLAIRLWR